MTVCRRTGTRDLCVLAAGIVLLGCAEQRIDLAPDSPEPPPAQPAAASSPASAGSAGFAHAAAAANTGGAPAPAGTGGVAANDPAKAMVAHPNKPDPDTFPDVTGPRIPVAVRTCPRLVGEGNYTFNNIPVHVFIAPNAASMPAPGGPFVVFWHDIGGGWQETETALGAGAIDEITARGGVVAVPLASNKCTGCVTTGADVWFLQDFGTTDEVLACAVEQAKIDIRHVHAVGIGAGGFQASAQMLNRASYMASVISYSGGESPIPGTQTSQDPSNFGAYLLTYGTQDSDVIMNNFKQQSEALFDHQIEHGAFVMMCATAGHGIDANIAPHALQFLLDHPYKVSPEPYARGIPREFPSYCTNHK
jgi:hypothetical protein